MFSGNINFDLLESYRSHQTAKTLGDVVGALSKNPIIDPNYGITLKSSEVSDHEIEPYLSDEEVRINRASKMLHPVYNAMSFPDRLDRSVRTITATCTRVSRESIVIRGSINSKKLRRLTLRERATLQGFPITYQFYGSTYSQKQKMIGNAMPPVFTYLIGNAIRGTSVARLKPIAHRAAQIKSPSDSSQQTPPAAAKKLYPADRTFRFAIPSLRLKSGVRFELSNLGSTDRSWSVQFYYGTSKDIRSILLDQHLYKRLMKSLPTELRSAVTTHLGVAVDFLAEADLKNLQGLWSHRRPGGTRPFALLDMLDSVARELRQLTSQEIPVVEDVLREILGSGVAVGRQKLERNAPLVLSGLVLGAAVNDKLSRSTGAPESISRKRA